MCRECEVLSLPLHAMFATCHKQGSSSGGRSQSLRETIRKLPSQLGLKVGAHTRDKDGGLGGDQVSTKLCRAITMHGYNGNHLHRGSTVQNTTALNGQ